jgi:hemolysin activation/secretion protein
MTNFRAVFSGGGYERMSDARLEMPVASHPLPILRNRSFALAAQSMFAPVSLDSGRPRAMENKVKSISCRTLRFAAVSAVLLVSAQPSLSQVRPAPDPTQNPQRAGSELPAPGAPDVKVVQPRPAHVAGDVKVRPAAFRIVGNTVFPESELLAQIAEFNGRELDLGGLADAAAKLRRFYAAAGYILTDVYVPQQSFPSNGGTIEFAVVEARVGKITVKVDPSSGVSESFAQSLVDASLPAGSLIRQTRLDRPILLLRDLPGVSASAAVTPGASVGEADIAVTIAPEGRSWEAWVGADNFGSEPSGLYRFTLAGSASRLLLSGDLLSAMVQPTSSGTDTIFYRVGYRAPIGPWGTKFNIGASRSSYVLGRQFEGLDASGTATIGSASLIQPIIRSRLNNLFVQAGWDSQNLVDSAAGQDTDRKINDFRLGILGNFADNLFGGASTSYGLTYTAGDLSIDTASALEIDQSEFGPRTDGSFGKLNVEFGRVQFFDANWNLGFNFYGQWASKNLTAAEKLLLTGPQAVRGYSVDSTAVVDQGLVATLALRYRPDYKPFEIPLNVSLFYDYGWGQINKVVNATTNRLLQGQPNTISIDSVGIGAAAGTDGKYLLSLWVATRLGDSSVVQSSSNSSVQFWFNAQYWF